MLGNLDTTCRRMKLEHSITPYTKINLKWIKDLNVRPGTTKLLEENAGRILFDINHSDIFLVPSPTVKETKAKIDKWGLMKFKSFCTAKETINRTKNNLWKGRKYLQTMWPTRNQFTKYISIVQIWGDSQLQNLSS